MAPSTNCPGFLNEVLSLNAQEFRSSLMSTWVGSKFLNEVLSLNAQESRRPSASAMAHTILNEVLSLNAQESHDTPT